ncbi:cytosine permease [Acidianus manzaensis]|uniref:Allantoin permease n=1 Tax=Acidianus manzaensis TaxID=282676 RepID=A0A1W6JYS3_9CREN|nr:cytosine permease [Acidianus manzaensis]ARM75419.1 allantoin permease [Acidianus manzaensis]
MKEIKISSINLDISDYNQGKHVIPESYYNPNIAPLPKGVKTWNWINFTTIWAGMVHNVVQFELAGLLTFELGAPLALTIIAIAYGTLLIALYLNGHIGAKWGIPYPTAVRPMFGIKGARIPVIIRAISALFWFALQTYIGGTIINAVLGIFFPAWNSLTTNVIGMPENIAISMLIFWSLNVLVLFRGMNEIKDFELIIGPIIMITIGGLFVYSLSLSHGLGPLFAVKGYEAPTISNILLAVSSFAAAYSTLALNIPDFTRFSKSQKDQFIGQAIGLPVLLTLWSFIAIGLSSTMIYLYHVPMSEAINYVNPVYIMFLLTKNSILSLIVGISFIIATISVNIAANMVSPVYDLISLFPKKISTWGKASILAALVSFLYAPWLWYNNAGTVENILGLIGSGLGAVAGIMIADYWILSKKHISLVDLFMPTGKYWYLKGYNIKALLSMSIGFLVPVIGFIIPQLNFLYDYGWYMAVLLSLSIYIILIKKVK